MRTEDRLTYEMNKVKADKLLMDMELDRNKQRIAEQIKDGGVFYTLPVEVRRKYTVGERLGNLWKRIKVVFG